MQVQSTTPDLLVHPTDSDSELDPQYVSPELTVVPLDPTDMAGKGPKKKGTWSVPIGCC